MIKRISAPLLRWSRRIVFSAALVCVTVILVWAFHSRNLPDLSVWHSPLDKEADAGDLEGLSYDEYVRLEDELFAELKEEVYSPGGAQTSLPNRYLSGSPSDPAAISDRNWNRSTVLMPDGEIKSGAVLLHGLTDSPYSMRSIAEILVANGCYTLCLRMPGHGTVPGSLVDAHWQDWFAAMEVAVSHVREKVGPEAALYFGGYSTGGSIALKYAIKSVDDDNLHRPTKVFLLGPPVRVHPLAKLTKAHKTLSWIGYFEKFKWLGVELEYDPYKYNSFPKNGGVQSFKLSQSLLGDLRDLRSANQMGQLAPVVTFQSVVDATVLTDAVVDDLYMPMSPNGSELVLFDINRYSAMEKFVRQPGKAVLDRLDGADTLPFRYTLVSNVSPNTREVKVQIREQGHTDPAEPTPLGLLWPHQVYSLSHVALPFRPDDPVYGYMVPAEEADQHLRLGAMTPRGERRLLQISMDLAMRLRSNPFFDVVEERIVSHLER